MRIFFIILFLFFAASNAMIKQPEVFSPFMQLPPELHLKIVQYMIATDKNFVCSLQALQRTNKYLKQLLKEQSAPILAGILSIKPPKPASVKKPHEFLLHPVLRNLAPARAITPRPAGVKKPHKFHPALIH